MRGSVNHQVNLVFRESGIFQPGKSKHKAKELARKELYQKGLSATSERIGKKLAIYSYGTAEKYKDTWHSLARFAKEQFGIKDVTKIDGEHVKAYLEQKIAQNVKYATFQRECAAIAKFEQALNKFTQEHGDKYKVFNREFNFRDTIQEVKETAKEVLDREIKDRGFENPKNVIDNLIKEEHKIVARIQYEGGARISEATHIKEGQLKGLDQDPVTKKYVGKIEIKGKGGKIREIYVSKETYRELERYTQKEGIFSVNKDTYSHAVNYAAEKAGEHARDTHSFRYNFAQERYQEYLSNGYTHEQALQGTSWEMGHERADITLHYLR